MAQTQDAFFKPERIMSIPTKDILSWTFDNLQFDQDKKVSDHFTEESFTNIKFS
jgi:hypothetical protein